MEGRGEEGEWESVFAGSVCVCVCVCVCLSTCVKVNIRFALSLI